MGANVKNLAEVATRLKEVGADRPTAGGQVVVRHADEGLAQGRYWRIPITFLVAGTDLGDHAL